MLSRLGSFLTSSIGKKMVMSATGLLLVVFLIVHLAGNLLIFVDADGAAFNAYGSTYHENPAFLYTAEVGLIVLFATHIWLAFRTSIDNREARPQRYAIRATAGKSSVASSSMFITGAIVLGFLVIHVLDFRLSSDAAEDLAHAVKSRLSSPLGGAIYMTGVLALGVHLSHALKSALQTLGISHPRFTPLIQRATLGLAVVLFLGFTSFPVVMLAKGPPSQAAETHAAPAGQHAGEEPR
jgi:succinate dehydrogenase / fumarate reductase cytochrome b subunit